MTGLQDLTVAQLREAIGPVLVFVNSSITVCQVRLAIPGSSAVK
jgi:hypothetical protein